MPEASLDNALAPVLADLIREFSETRLLHSCERDYMAWLQGEVCRARGWTPWDVSQAWWQELDRRAHDRAVVRGEGRAA